MSHPKKMNRTAAGNVRKQLANDEFIQLLTNTTLFRNIPPIDLPLNTLERLCSATDIVPLLKNRTLKIELHNPEKLLVYEILSGFVKIYDRAVLKSEQRLGLTWNPPALLAWRVPGELLGDFQFTLPDETREDHIVATDDCRLLKIPARLIREIAQSHPQLYFNVATNLASKATKGRIRAQILRLPKVEYMVAKLFIELLAERKADEQPSGRLLVNGTFRIDDIAAFLGHGYHSTQAGIHELISQKLIKHHRNIKSGRFEICNLKGLHRFLETELTKAEEQKKQKRRNRANEDQKA